MHKEILSKKQLELFRVVEDFSKQGFYLAGGTALALQLGHRESIDFDLFRFQGFNNGLFDKYFTKNWKDTKVTKSIDVLDEYTIFLNDTKITFLCYPFELDKINKIEEISMASPLDIAAMKAYALGRRGKWKDYVDLYFLLQSYEMDEILLKSKEIFKSLFSEKLFLQQLCYFNDVDFSETIIWKIKNPPTETTIKNFLIEQATKKEKTTPY